MPVQGTCHPSVRKSFFFGGSFGSFCSFTFDAVAFGADLEVIVFGCTFNKILAIIPFFFSFKKHVILIPYQLEVLALQLPDSTTLE